MFGYKFITLYYWVQVLFHCGLNPTILDPWPNQNKLTSVFKRNIAKIGKKKVYYSVAYPWQAHHNFNLTNQMYSSNFTHFFIFFLLS